MISIIVPVYNVELYLDKCLESIQNQIYQDWECILVNDGSKDKSAEICDTWAKKDNRFTVIHQHNQGVSIARNNGITVSKGEYITFIDSDDWVCDQYLQDLLTYTDTDLVVSGVTSHYNNGSKNEVKPIEHKTFKLSECYVEYFVDLNRKYLLYAPYSKLFKSNIIKQYQILFPINCSYGEDLQFNYHYLEHVKTITQIDVSNYNYRIIGNNTLSTKKRQNQFNEDYEQWKLLKNFHVRHNLWLEPTKQLLYKRLWGIVYDGIFSSFTDIKIILSIPEIKELKDYKDVFTCSWWIKYGILYKLNFLFKR